MAFELKNIVPWGRNLSEYRSMFHFTDAEMDKKIISFGDGPACFNCEMTALHKSVVSIDPIYRFSKKELKQRFDETREIVLEQTKDNMDNFVWTKIKNLKDLDYVRSAAMDAFLDDFEKGKKEGRYINHEMPDKTAFEDQSFDLGLSSHFLILYSQLGLDFHIATIIEMLRIAKEIRIFPILNLDAKRSELLDDIISHFSKEYSVDIVSVEYEFQKNGNQMLMLRRK